MANEFMQNAGLNNSGLSQKAAVGEQGGRVRLIKDSFAWDDDAASTATDDNILIGGKLPAGAKIVDCYYYNSDNGSAVTGGTATVGWLASDELDDDGNPLEALQIDGLLAAPDVVTSATITRMDGSNFILGKTFAAEVQLIVNVSAGFTPNTIGESGVMITYVVE